MKRQSVYLIFTLVLFLTSTISMASGYNFISAEKMKENLEAGDNVIIVDIQVEKEFNEHHIPGSLATYAYPVKSDSDRLKVDKAVKKYEETGKNVVIVCPRGKGGAKRCYDYMKAHNVPEEKLAILENGMSGWPYKELVEKN